MKQVSKLAMTLGATLIGTSASWADTLQTHRIPAVLALEAVGEAVATCAKQGYRETVTVLDADGATIATLRGDGASIHTLDSAHDKAYTSVSFMLFATLDFFFIKVFDGPEQWAPRYHLTTTAN